MKRVVNILFLFLFLIFVGGFVSSSYEIGNASHFIEKSYAPKENIKGWINISFNNEPSNSIFSDSQENSITLVNLLNQNQNFVYTCSTTNCISDYSTSNAENTKIFNLGDRESNIVGLKFSGNILSIDSIDFTVESDAASSCYNQLEIDLLNDGTIDMGNNKILDTTCSFLKNYGCFNDSKSISEYSIGYFPNKHCQKIKLSESPGFMLGAFITKNNDARNLTMALFNINGNSIEGANCYLPESTGEGEISCDIDYLVVKSKDYYVCIYSDESGGNSTIKGYYDPAYGCGFYGTNIQNEIAGFKIFAEAKKFKAIGTLEILNSLGSLNTLGTLSEDYIWDKYGTLNCLANDCIIPIKFISKVNQQITIRDLTIAYQTTLGPTSTGDFYDLIETPSKINSMDFQKLNLNESNFSLPSNYGNFTFKLKLNDEDIFSEKVTIERIPLIKEIIPTITASALATQFEAIIDSFGNITQYDWDFGTGHTEITITNKVTYIYNQTGNYKLKITVTDSNERSSFKIFDILVETPIKAINKTLKEKLENLVNINTQIKKFDLFDQETLNSELDMKNLEEGLAKIQEDYKTASSEEDYNKIMTDLLKLKVPKSITKSKSTDLISFYPKKDYINLNIIQLIGGGTYEIVDESEYIDAIVSWNQEKIETKIIFKEFSTINEYFYQPFLKIFKLKINKKPDSDYDSYLVLRELDNLKFKEDYSEKRVSGYIYIDLTKDEEVIEFSTTEDINFMDLPVFISPGLDGLVITTEENLITKEKTSKWALFILIIFFLGIIGFVIYIILQEWYKKKYESYLFKNKNDLYNIFSYITSSKNKGLKKQDISNKLKKAGWNTEQIKYVIKKYAGKTTGMFEIPVGKILNKFKKKNIKQIPRRNFRLNQKLFRNKSFRNRYFKK